MDQKHELALIVENWNLLKHPFYEAWTSGTLTLESLQIYAREYGAFIETLPLGWRSLKDEETAGEEIEHADLWKTFTDEIGGTKTDPQFTETVALVITAELLFSQPATALGALYAFEVQQPATAASKLDGLNKWYDISAAGNNYFELHSTNWHESQKILTQINALPGDEQKSALKACSIMSEALWNGLTGIHKRTCAN